MSKHVNLDQCLLLYQKTLKFMLYQQLIHLNHHGELIAHLKILSKENILDLVWVIFLV